MSLLGLTTVPVALILQRCGVHPQLPLHGLQEQKHKFHCGQTVVMLHAEVRLMAWVHEMACSDTRPIQGCVDN